MRIALLQDSSVALDAETNLQAIARAAGMAREDGADLLVTPELFVHGYAPESLRASLSAEAAAQAVEDVRRIAAETGIALVCSVPGSGRPEARGIDALLVDAGGSVLARYTKTHLFGPAERAAFTPGEGPPPIVSLGDLRIGLLICYDVEFPECARELAVRGADLIAVPTALAGDVPGVTDLLVPARALENGISIAYANHTGHLEGLQFLGRSLVVGPDGAVLAAAGEAPELLIADVAPRSGRPADAADEPPAAQYLHDRRPGLYRSWSQPQHPPHPPAHRPPRQAP